MAANICFKRPSITILVIVLALILLIPATIHAELSGYFVQAMPGWTGTTNIMNGSLDWGDLQYAVFAPNSLPLDLRDVNFNTIDVNQYVYAYQLFNDSSNNLTFLTIALDPLTTSADSNITDTNDIGGDGDGSTNRWLTSTARWQFSLTPGEHKSKILLFNSPYSAQFYHNTSGNSGSVAYGASSGTLSDVPTPLFHETPTPEPATLYGLIIACGFFFSIRKLRVFK